MIYFVPAVLGAAATIGCACFAWWGYRRANQLKKRAQSPLLERDEVTALLSLSARRAYGADMAKIRMLHLGILTIALFVAALVLFFLT